MLNEVMQNPLTGNDLGDFAVVENCPTLSVRDALAAYRKALLSSGIQVDGVKLRFATSKTHGGGTRLWLACPACGRRCGKLYRHPDFHQLGCRQCLYLTYYQQRYKGMTETEV